jgi:hypothetical protein
VIVRVVFCCAVLVLTALACSSGKAGASFASSSADGSDGDDDGNAPDDASSAPEQAALSLESSVSTRCVPGTYVGTYTGTYESTIPTTGPVSLTLTQSTSSNGENFLVTSGGDWMTEWGLMAADASLPLVTGEAMLVGQLDCGANQFTATAAPGSMFTILGVPSGTFTLSLTGSYDATTSTLGGSFSYTSNAGNGSGTWTTQRM